MWALIYKHKSAFIFFVAGSGDHPSIHGSPATESNRVCDDMVGRSHQGGSPQLVPERRLSDHSDGVGSQGGMQASDCQGI